MSTSTDAMISKGETAASTRTVRPRVDVYVNDDGFKLVGDFPGVKPDGFDVRVDEGRLILEGVVEKTEHHAGFRYHRSFTLPRELDLDKLEAALADGVLTLSLPRGDQARVRAIPISGPTSVAAP